MNMDVSRYIYKHPETEDRVFEIRKAEKSEFPELWYEGSLVGKMVDRAECRRVAWNYLVGLGLNPDELTEDDFKDVKICRNCDQFSNMPTIVDGECLETLRVHHIDDECDIEEK